MIQKVTHLTLFVNNQDDALTFYIQKLGFKKHTDVQFGEMRWITVCPSAQPNFEIALMLAQTPEQKAVVGKQSPAVPLYAVSTDDCNKTFQNLKANGVEIIEEPSEQPWGIQCLFKDIVGNVICMVQEKN